MKLDTTYISLTDEELALLDEQCRPEIQAKVDAAKERLADAGSLAEVPDEVRQFVVRVLEEARQGGQIGLTRKSLTSCKVCDKRAGYAGYTRNTKYHRKGEPNYDRPRTMSGVELARRFVTIKGSATVGCCRTCWEVASPYVAEALKDIQAEVAEAITGHPPRWKKYDNRECNQCGWQGYEGQMGKLPAMFGGYYPGKCPQCGAENLPLGPRNIESRDGFTVVAAT